MSRPPRLLMVGLDAADGELVLRWMEEGRLPVLAGLADRGTAMSLRSAGEHMPESSWASLVSGCGPGDHGIYSWRIVQPGTARRVRTAAGGRRAPFWSVLRRHGPEPRPRLVLFDVPYASPDDDPGVTQLGGWGLRVTRELTCSPAGLWDELKGRHRAYPSWVNRDYERGPLSERRYRHTLSRLADRRADLALELLSRRPWELAIVNFTEPHFAGHAFFHHLRTAEPPQRLAEHGASSGLLDVYRATDRNLGRLLAAAGPETNILAFSTIGLRPNETADELLRRVLIALGYEVPAARQGRESTRRRAMGAATRATPRFLRHRLRSLLPAGTVEGMADGAWAEGIDWRRSRAVSEAEPGSGWIRICLEGREPAGTVPESEREGLMRAIADDLSALTDAETGATAVAEVIRVEHIAPGEAARDLPDLLVRWAPGRRIHAVRHPRAGTIDDGEAHYARTEHTGGGFLVAAGPQIDPAGPAVAVAREMDLAPTVLELFGCPIPAAMRGRPLEGLLRGNAGAERSDIDIAVTPAWADGSP